jgi:hypothetical protein
MNPMKMLWIALVLCCQFCFAQGRGSKVAPSGETTVSAALGKTKAEASFRTSTVQVSGTQEKHRRFAQCTYSRIPCSLTEQVRVLIDGSEVFIPRSAYADLGDITTAEFAMNDNRVTLTIRGGDASESYVAKLLFGKDGLTERRLYSGEDEQHPLQVTHYYQVSAAD